MVEGSEPEELGQNSIEANSKIIMLLTGILILKAVEVVYFLHKAYKNSLKKKYYNNGV